MTSRNTLNWVSNEGGFYIWDLKRREGGFVFRFYGIIEIIHDNFFKNCQFLPSPGGSEEACPSSQPHPDQDMHQGEEMCMYTFMLNCLRNARVDGGYYLVYCVFVQIAF